MNGSKVAALASDASPSRSLPEAYAIKHCCKVLFCVEVLYFFTFTVSSGSAYAPPYHSINVGDEVQCFSHIG